MLLPASISPETTPKRREDRDHWWLPAWLAGWLVGLVNASPPWMAAVVATLALLVLLSFHSFSGRSESADRIALEPSTADLEPGVEVGVRVGVLPPADGLAGRSERTRSEAVIEAGGTPESERAVAAALHWLAEHQMADGGWSFNHAEAPSCKGKCSNSGSATQARNAATAMALLPFMGAGQTHRSGSYQEVVQRGLDFLLRHEKQKLVFGAGKKARKKALDSPLMEGSTFFEPRGQMYAHGLASIAVSEAYGMTGDKQLLEPAQDALDFIASAQDPVGGGWRYRPRERGDTSVVGWQIMALKSGQLAGLHTRPETSAAAMRYLDGVQTNGGANYGYTDPQVRDATTAIGLLSRMMLGWQKDNDALRRGVDWLSTRGPSADNMYYNYYATQVMRHWEGEKWKKWNEAMREQLVHSQARQGHEAGSWFMPGGDLGAGPGGRLYFTSLAALTLEIYYRYLPLYRTQRDQRIGE